jgi:simple sugar transport system permease protein/ribose transport system permease protein
VVAIAIIIVLAMAGLTTRSFLTLDNMLVIVRAASITGIVAVGMSFVTISGNLFALSAGPMAALFGIVFALLLQAGAGIVFALLATIVLAIVAGLLQGIVINVIRNPIITTIAYGAVFAGLAALLSRNTLIRVHDTSPLWFGTARPFGVPMQSWTFVILTIIASLLTVTTRIGRLMVLSGANRATAIASGLRVGLATNIAMALFSFGAAIVAIFSVAQFSLAKADQYSGLDIDSIASVLVGGIALRGGNGSPLQAALGAVLIAVLQNFMLLRGWSTGVRLLVVGIVLVLATTSFHLLQRRSR